MLRTANRPIARNSGIEAYLFAHHADEAHAHRIVQAASFFSTDLLLKTRELTNNFRHTTFTKHAFGITMLGALNRRIT